MWHRVCDLFNPYENEKLEETKTSEVHEDNQD